MSSVQQGLQMAYGHTKTYLVKSLIQKYLSAPTKGQIIEVMLELYDAHREAKEYLEFYLSPNEDQKLEEYKRIIRDEFFP